MLEMGTKPLEIYLTAHFSSRIRFFNERCAENIAFLKYKLEKSPEDLKRIFNSLSIGESEYNNPKWDYMTSSHALQLYKDVHKFRAEFCKDDIEGIIQNTLKEHAGNSVHGCYIG